MRITSSLESLGGAADAHQPSGSWAIGASQRKYSIERMSVERTRRSLGQINRASLPVLRQKAYDDAQSFVKQAEEQLNAKNLVFARELADKAERLAKELTGR